MSAGNNIIQNVSRETLDALRIYERSLRQWQERINLVATSTLSELWNRHFIDSYQLVNIINGLPSPGGGMWFVEQTTGGEEMFHMKHSDISNPNHPLSPPLQWEKNIIIADLGSGAGFPGMILALAGIPNVHLIESDQRKCAFLRDVSREIFGAEKNQNVSRETFRPTIHNKRIENVSLEADLITSRAFANLAKTLEISTHLRHEKTVYLLLKPLDLEKELAESAKNWYFKHEIIPSLTDPRGCVLKIYDVVKK